jgi:hypothetical protein
MAEYAVDILSRVVPDQDTESLGVKEMVSIYKNYKKETPNPGIEPGPPR